MIFLSETFFTCSHEVLLKNVQQRISSPLSILFSLDLKIDTSKVQMIFKYELRRETNSSETTRNIYVAFGEEAAN